MHLYKPVRVLMLKVLMKLKSNAKKYNNMPYNILSLYRVSILFYVF